MAPCHGLRILEEELERIVYDKMLLRLQTAQEKESHIPLTAPDGLGAKIEEYQQEKRKLYEQFVAQKINLEDYKTRKLNWMVNWNSTSKH